MKSTVKRLCHKWAVDLLFFKWNKIKIQKWLIAFFYLINFFDINIYVNITVLIYAILHKLYTDTYITDRYISIIILVITILFRLFSLFAVYHVLLLFIIHDTMWYTEIEQSRKRIDDYQLLENTFRQNYKMNHTCNSSSDTNEDTEEEEDCYNSDEFGLEDEFAI